MGAQKRHCRWFLVIMGSQCFVPLAIGQWSVTGTLNDWEQNGATWTLSADAAGTSYLRLSPISLPTEDWGLSCRIRWKQDLSGSGANFSRLHWLTDTGGVAVEGWQSQPDLAPGSFFHLGETGTNDSLRWFSLIPAASNSTFSVLSPSTNAHFSEPMELELEWHQPPDSDTAWVGIRRMDAFGNQSALCFLSKAVHALPQSLAFSAEFTSSHTTDFEFEVLQFGPYIPDLIAPKIHAQEFRTGPVIQIQFNEPIAANTGVVLHGPLWDSIPYLFNPALNQLEFLPLADWEIGQSRRIKISEFFDVSGNEMGDTLIDFHRTHSLINDPGDLIFTEIMIESEAQGEWIELLNASDHAIRLADLLWKDGSTSTVSNLEPMDSWDGVLEPEERAIFMCSEGTNPLVSQHKAQIQSNSTFHNSGESLQLMNIHGEILNELIYTLDWWETSQEGIHLQKRYLTACNIQENWFEGSQPPSPGMASSDEDEALSIESFYPTHSLPLGPQHGSTFFNLPLDPSHTPLMHQGHAWWTLDSPHAVRWELDSVPPDTDWRLRLSNMASCYSEKGEQTAWPINLHVQSFPVPGDLVIAEISHHPQGLSEQWGSFVEVLNASSKTIELAGVEVNRVTCNTRTILHPSDRFCFESIDLPTQRGNVMLKDVFGEVLHEVSYRACWHRDRSKENAGFSLVRLHTQHMENGIDSWRDWDSSSDARGCSFASPDATELIPLTLPTEPDPVPLLCGQFQGQRILLLSEAHDEFKDGWIPLKPEVHGNWLWAFEPHTVWLDLNPLPEEIFECPSIDQINFEAQLTLNEIRRLRTNGEEPFIELANSSDLWGTTKGWQWSTETPSFPDDWKSITPEIQWFIPPYQTVAWAHCPSRVNPASVLIPADLPSTWSTFSLQLARDGEHMDLVWIEPDMESPWHSLDHSLERTTIHSITGSTANWKSSSHASGHSAGEWNSWQLQHPISSIQPIVALQDTWYRDGTGNICPIQLQITAPGEGAWEVQLKIVDGNGTDLRSFHEETWAIHGETPHIIHWDGLSNNGTFTPGTYWVIAQFQSLHSQDFSRYSLPIHLSLH